MKYKELRKQAEKKVQTKIAFYTCAIVFTGVSVVLMMLSYFIPSISQWLMLPIPIFLMILAIMYLAAFGLPWTGEHSDDWQEEEIEKEMLRLYRKKKQTTQALKGITETEVLELEELERLHSQKVRREDFV